MTQIITDSGADLTAADIQRWNLKVIPLMINFPDGEMVNSESLTPDQFFDRLKAVVPAVPTTSQPSLGDILNVYNSIDGDVLAIHISSGLSGTANTAALAAQQIGNNKVIVIDTRTLSPGERYQVLGAAMALEKGWSREKIVELTDKLRTETEVIFTLETLDYLARGGRIGRVQALAGSLLQIKPIIHVDITDGKYSTKGRARTIAQALTSMASSLAERYGKTEPVWATIVHGQLPEKASQFETILRANLNVAKMETVRLSPVLGVHTGPGLVGVGVVPMRLFDGLL